MNSPASNVGVQPLPSQNTQPTFANIGTSIDTGQGTYGGLGGQFLPTAEALTSNITANPYAPQAQQGAITAGGMGQQAAFNQYGLGGVLGQYGASILPYASAITNTALDPQAALYQRTLAQTQQQQDIANAMSGVGTSPYGMGLQAQNLQNFNIDWQNNRLTQMIAGAQAAGNLGQAAGGIIGTGTGLQTGAAPLFMQSAAMPYATSVGQAETGLQGLQGLFGIGTQGANLQNLGTQDWLAMAAAQAQANQAATGRSQAQLQQAALEQQYLSQLGQGVGSAVGWLGGTGPQTFASNIGSGLGGLGSWLRG